MIVTLGGCAATQTLVSKKDLEVQVKTSTAIFVDPVPQNKRTVYLDVKSGVMEFDRREFKQFVRDQFVNSNDNNYVLVDNPEEAQFTMVVYVLNLEKTSPTAAEQALKSGYMGGAIAAGATVGAIANSSNRYTGAGAGAIAGGAIELVSSSLVKDVFFMLVCDIQIKEKLSNGAVVRKDTQVDTKVSDAGSSRQSVSEVSARKEYRTRIVTTANQVNLELASAKELMFKKTGYALSGFF